MPEKILIQRYDSPCGGLLLGSFGGRLCLCNWTQELHPGRVGRRLGAGLAALMVEQPSETTFEAARQLDEYFGGGRKDFAVPLLFVGTAFQQAVWNGLLSIPYGATVSYGELAARIGHPMAVRAVAGAVGANALSIFAPCHRVVGSDGSLTGFGGGVRAKRYLLDLERRWSIPTVF